MLTEKQNNCPYCQDPFMTFLERMENFTKLVKMFSRHRC